MKVVLRQCFGYSFACQFHGTLTTVDDLRYSCGAVDRVLLMNQKRVNEKRFVACNRHASVSHAQTCGRTCIAYR
jgi:hypothetical protein